MRKALIGIWLALAITACTPEDPTPRFSDARIVLPPAGQMAAGYFNIENPGPDPIRILSIRAPQFRMAEIHQTVFVNGMSKMREVENAEVPARSSRSFEPGGWHIMLMGYEDSPAAHKTLSVEIEWQSGDTPAQRTNLEFKTQSAGKAG